MRPSAVETPMTENLDVKSEGVDKQSVDVWNEVLDYSDDSFNKIGFLDDEKTGEKQHTNNDES